MRDGQLVPMAKIEKLQLFTSSKRHDKLRGPVCREAIVASVERSGAYAAKVARARFRASKVNPDAAIWRADRGVAALGRRLADASDVRAVANTGKLLASIGEAKSRAIVPAESAEKRIARTASLGVSGQDRSTGRPGDA
jgi:hypothetical protein